ncbi:MAG: hypothetical protein M3O02_06590 [Acidobacteriota bacterium]|nr:hypothetical protein [Acidobacteriota bacterium]
MHGIFDTPFAIPIFGILLGGVAIVSGIFSQAHARRIKAEQRMAMVARGMKPEEIVMLLGDSTEGDAQANRAKYPLRGLANARRIAIVLCSIGVGLMLFFSSLVLILRDREIYSGAAIGFIPLAIGIGFFIDYHLQKRDLARFGLEVETPPV